MKEEIQEHFKMVFRLIKNHILEIQLDWNHKVKF